MANEPKIKVEDLAEDEKELADEKEELVEADLDKASGGVRASASRQRASDPCSGEEAY